MSALFQALGGDLSYALDAYNESRTSRAQSDRLIAEHAEEDRLAAEQDTARANPAIEAISAIRQIDRTPFVVAALCRSIAFDVIARAGWSHTAEAEMAINALRDLADDLEAA